MIGSRQLHQYLDARRAGTSRDEAAALAGMNAEEARLHDIAEEAGEYVELAPWPTTHNQKEDSMSESVAADELRLLVERVERLEEEKKALSDDIKDIYQEAKSRGYDAKTIRRVVRLRKMETHVREEQAALLETYGSALGMQLSFL